MRAMMGYVTKERLVAMMVHELFCFGRNRELSLAAGCQGRLSVGWRKKRNIKPLLLRFKSSVPKMPLSKDAGRVTGASQHLGKRYFLQRQLPFDSRLQQALRRCIGPTRKVVRQIE